MLLWAITIHLAIPVTDAHLTRNTFTTAIVFPRCSRAIIQSSSISAFYIFWTICPSVLVSCAPLASPVNNFAEIVSLVPKYVSLANEWKNLMPRLQIDFIGEFWKRHWSPLKQSSIIRDLGLILQLGSWDFRIVSPAIDTWCLVSIALLENFLVAYNNFTWISLNSRDYFYEKPPPNTLINRVSNSYFNRANDRLKFDYWGGRKILFYFRLYVSMK